MMATHLPYPKLTLSARKKKQPREPQQKNCLRMVSNILVGDLKLVLACSLALSICGCSKHFVSCSASMNHHDKKQINHENCHDESKTRNRHQHLDVLNKSTENHYVNVSVLIKFSQKTCVITLIIINSS